MSARSALAALALLAALIVMSLAALSLASPPGTVAARPGGARAAGPAHAAHAAHARPRYPDHFPQGAGDDIAERACAICHSPMLVAQQAKDSLGWEKTLALMEKWGAPVAAGAHDSLRTYLLSRFGPKPAAH